MAFIFSVIGVILVLEGIPYFAFPSRIKRWALTIATVPDRELRIMGLVSMISGIVVLYLVKYYMR
ncbi:MAG TPA: DUF2065 domain-containing protein [Deltaproteobacteria bacterium]|nr:DUF2065 domain-containing protein [Deltaproteobacteria bacterium]